MTVNSTIIEILCDYQGCQRLATHSLHNNGILNCCQFHMDLINAIRTPNQSILNLMISMNTDNSIIISNVNDITNSFNELNLNEN